MAEQSMLMGLLKTPSQIRKEQQDRLMEESLARSQQMIVGGGTTALPGIISRYGAQAAQRGAMAGAGLLRGVAGGLGTAVGGDMGQRIADLGVTAEERQAREQQNIMSGVQMGNATSLKNAAEKLRQAGNIKAALALEERASALVSAQAELTQKTRELDIKEQENVIKGLKSYAAMTLKVGDDVVENSDPAAVAQALNLVETDPKKLNEARSLLKAKPGAKTEITIDQKGESEFLKTLGKEQATQYTEGVGNIQANTASVRTLNEMESLMNSGEIFTGAGANVLLQASKVLNLAGLGDEEKVARTETFMKTAAQEVLNIMGSGKLGAGTGLSDGDRKFAAEVVAGDITLSEKAIRDLIDVNRRANVYAIKKHNQRVDQLNLRYKNANLPREFYIGQEAVVDDVTYTYDGEGWVAQ